MTRSTLDDALHRATEDLRDAAAARAAHRPSRASLERGATVRHRTTAALTVALVAVAVLGVTRLLPRGSVPAVDPGPGPTTSSPLLPLRGPTGAVVVVATDRAIVVLDVDGNRADTAPLRREFGLDDRTELAIIGSTIVFSAGAGTFTTPMSLDHVEEPFPLTTGVTTRRAGWFLPAADPDRIWRFAEENDGVSATLAGLEGEVVAPPRLLPPGIPVAALPEGLLLRGADGLVAWDASTGGTEPVDGPATLLAARGRTLATCGEGCDRLRLADLGDAAAAVTVHAPSGTAFRAGAGAFSPDGQHLAIPLVARSDGSGAGLTLVDPSDGTLEVIARSTRPHPVQHVAWAPTGDLLLFDIVRSRLGAWRLGDPPEQIRAATLPPGGGGRVIALAVAERAPFVPPAEPDRVGDIVTLLEIEVGDVPRRLGVWRRTDGSVCVQLEGTSCTAPPEAGDPAGRGHLLARFASSSLERDGSTHTCEYGMVSEDVSEARLRLADGTFVPAQVVSAPPPIEGRYYAVCMDREPGRTTLVLLDANGTVLQRHES